MWRKDKWLLLVAVLMLLLGLYLRAQDLAFPENFTFDEDHFVRNARNYIVGLPDWNDHPPLGKLVIMLGIRLFGDNAVGWRVGSLTAGIASLFCAYGLASSLFSSKRAGLLAAACLAADGFFIAYSRTALLDGPLACFILAAAWTIVAAKRPWHIALACVLIGLAASIKFTGIVLIPALLLVTLVLRRAPRWTAVFVALSPIVYWACFALGLATIGRPYGPTSVVNATHALLSHHLALTDMRNPATSYWYQWFLPVKPILLRVDPAPEGQLRVMSSMGNPILWWTGGASLLATFLACLQWLGVKVGWTRADRNILGYFQQALPKTSMLLLFWTLPMLPWILTKRDSYIYHYLACYGFALILVAGGIDWLYAKRRIVGLIALIAIAELSVFYAPVWGQFPLTKAAMEQRLFMEKWR
jgi:dolichyl-phosphate-mannose--protein O-mannosyl transferase